MARGMVRRASLRRALPLLLFPARRRNDFDYYIDSISGSDSNAGTSAAAAKATLGALTLANNNRVGIKAGASAVGAKSIAGLTGVTLGVYGTGNPEAPAGFSRWTPSFTARYLDTDYGWADPVSVSKTYYVDKATGNDGNAGTEAEPLATITAAGAKSDVDRIAVKAGRYFNDLPANGRIAEARAKLSLVPWGEGRPALIGGADPAGLTWADEGDGVWSTTVSSCHIVVDLSKVDTARGLLPLPLTQRADLAALDAAADGYAVVSTTVYVKCGREPDSDIIPLTNRQGILNYYLRQFYVRGWDVFGFAYACFIQPSSTGSPEGYDIFDDCRIAFQSANGLNYTSPNITTHVYTRRCVIGYTKADCISYAGPSASGKYFNGLEQQNIAYNSGWNDTLDNPNQCSTTHNDCNVIRVGCDYSLSGGQVIADTSNAQTWNVGMKLGAPRTTGPNRDRNVTVGNAGTKSWYDVVLCLGSAGYSFEQGTSAELYYRGALHESPMTGTVTEY